MKKSRLLTLLLLVAPLAVNAASFECAKAKTAAEKTICANQELSALDEELARRYAASLSAASGEEDKATLRREQRAWLKSRDACQSARCFAESYRQRIATLQAKPQSPQQAKRYPPYPEVWGYEFPFFSADQRQVNRRHVIWSYSRTPTGDIKVSYWLPDNRPPEHKGAQGQEGKILGELHFFSGERRFLSGPEADEERKRPSMDRDTTSTVIEKITFNDGSVVRVKVLFDQAFDGKCFTSHPYSIQRLDRNGQVVAWKSIVYVHDRPLRRISHQICNGGKKNVALERSTTDRPNLIALDDETFLVNPYAVHYILRFDKELRTKYLPRGKLYVVDTQVIEGIRAKHEHLPWPRNEQMINDEVTQTVLQMTKRRTK